MPHVDEGTLHAYLDGALDAIDVAAGRERGSARAGVDAHLAHCADCRALLERERAVRDGALDILGGVAPVDVPPFETITEAGAATRPPRRGRMMPLAWAATVVLALGVGWWGSELRQRSAPAVGGTPSGTQALDRAAQSEPAPDEGSLSERAAAIVSDAAALQSGTAAAERGVANPELAAPRPGGDALPAPPSAVAPAPLPTRDRQLAADDSARAVQRLAEERRQAGGMADAARVAAVADTVVAGSAAEQIVAQRMQARLQTDTGARQVAQRPLPAVAAAPPPPARSLQFQPQTAAVGAPANTFDVLPNASSVMRFQAALIVVRAARVNWSEASADAPPIYIDGAATARVDTARHDGAELTRVRQRIAGGEIELVLWREPRAAGVRVGSTELLRAETVAAPRYTILPLVVHDTRDAGAQTMPSSEVLLLLDEPGDLVSVRAPLPASELQALLSRLRLR